MGSKSCIWILVLLIFTGTTSFSQKKETANPLVTLSATNIQFKQAYQFKKTGNFPAAITYFQKAFHDVHLNNDKASEITCLYWLASTELSLKNYPIALGYVNSADSLLLKTKIMHAYLLNINYLRGLLYYKTSDLQKAYVIFEDCVQKSKSMLVQDSIMARVFARKGSIEYVQGNYLLAIKTFEQAKTAGLKAFGKYSEFVADQLNALGVMNFVLARNDEALSYYMQSQTLINQSHNVYAYGLATSYCNIALVFQTKNDYENALLFLNKALELYRSDPEDGPTTMTNVYINLSSVYQNMGNFDKQFENLNLSLFYAEKYKPESLPKICWMFATYYTNIKDYKKATEYYQLAISKNKLIFGEGPELAYILDNYGFFVENYLHNHEKAIQLFQQSLPLHLKYFGFHNPSTGCCYFNLGTAYAAKNNFEKALWFYQKALLCTSEKDENMNIYHHPDIHQSLDDGYFTNILKAKAAAFGKLALLQQNPSAKTKLLLSEYENNTFALQVIDKVRAGYINEESRLYISENELPTYQTTIVQAMNLYKRTGNVVFLKNAYAFSDKVHAASLQLVIKENSLPLNFKLSDSLAFREHQLKKDLSVYHELIIKEKTSKHIDSLKLQQWDQHVSDLTISIERIENLEKKKNPAYYQLKLQEKPSAQIKSIQLSLQNNEVMLEYFYTDSLLYVYYIGKQDLKFKETPIPHGFEKDIENVISFVRHPKISNSDAEDAKKYKIAAWNLYASLIKPFEMEIKGKSIIIIPYDKLNYIPFEALLTEPCVLKPLSFKQLPYLLKSNTIRYSYAGCLLSTQNKTHLTKGNIGAFAPIYQKSKVFAINNSRNGSLSSLKRTAEECTTIRNYFPVDIFSSQNASEENFKRVAGKYSSLHLAMHSVIDDENPMYSYLAFTSHSSLNEDDKLYTYEIYNLNLNVEMLVLSACNTGNGKLRKGEGMMSLTRGFAFAGVPSMVTTLWSVNDNTSASLMNLFYKELTTGNKKGESLSNAKKLYLDEADILHSHPYYWAGYVLIGDNTPFRITQDHSLTLWLSTFFVIILIAIWLLRRRTYTKLTQRLTQNERKN